MSLDWISTAVRKTTSTSESETDSETQAEREYEECGSSEEQSTWINSEVY